jgi:hypothetical protein
MSSGSKKTPKSGFYSIKRSFWRTKVFIPPNEGKTTADQMRLTSSLINAARAKNEREVIAFLDAGAYPNGHLGSDGAAIHAASA